MSDARSALRENLGDIIRREVNRARTSPAIMTARQGEDMRQAAANEAYALIMAENVYGSAVEEIKALRRFCDHLCVVIRNEIIERDYFGGTPEA